MRSRHDELIDALPDDWPVYPLSDVADRIESGGTPSRAVPAYWGGEIPWVTPGELTNLGEKYLNQTRESISVQGLSGSGASLLPRDSLLVTTRATLGSVVLAGCALSTNQGFKCVIFHRSVDPSFYFHLFKLLVPELARRSSGTTFLEISGKQFGQIPVPVPPLTEQRRIAAILDTVDQAIRSTVRLIAKLEQVKQGLLLDLLTRGIDEFGHLRNPNPHQFRDSACGQIPTAWRVSSLGELVDPRRPIVYGILMPGKAWEGGVPVVKVKDISNEIIQEDDLLLISPRIDAAYSRSRLQPGDLLFTIRGTVGRMAFVQTSLADANITQDTARIAITHANKRFVWYYLRMPVPIHFIELHTLGQAVRGINLQDVRRIPIALPPRVEQEPLTRPLVLADDRIRCERDRLVVLRATRQGLMEDLLTGRVRVNVGEEVST
jgi:type I restriction enzyme S subunit